jgi:hypothetical protein
MKMSEDMIEIATLASISDFTLWERPSKSADWRSFKLERIAGYPLPKNTWWFGWNGERLSAGRDSRLLKEHQPEVYDWVVSTLSEAACSTSATPRWRRTR